MNNIVYGIHSVSKLLQQKSKQVFKLLIQQNRHDKRAQEILHLAKNNNIEVQFIAVEELNQLTKNANHQGVIAMTEQSSTYNEYDLSKFFEKQSKPPLFLILDGVQDPHNLGACMRTANAFGVDAVIAPKNNAVGLTEIAKKVACGAAEITPFIQVTNLVNTMKQLKELGVWLYGADLTAIDNIYTIKFSGAIGLVLGAEENGIRRLTRETCDFLFKIPMAGEIESLNVSVATGVCLGEITRQMNYS